MVAFLWQDLFMKIVNEQIPLIIFSKGFIIDTCASPKYAFVYNKNDIYESSDLVEKVKVKLY